MKIFLDTANVEDIKKYRFFIDGITTNPSLIAKEGKEFRQVVKEICKLVGGPISAEAISSEVNEMISEAKDLSRIHRNIVVKIPMTKNGLEAVKALSQMKIKTNVTLVFSATQALLAAKAGASFVSPFVGRLDDIGQTGMELVDEILQIYKNYNFKTEVIVASIRNPIHVKEAAMLGAHISTVPPNVFKQMFDHALTDKGIKQFLQDWEKVPK